MDSLTLEAEPRVVTGRKVAELRRMGITPIHIYGKGIESSSLQADSPSLQKVVVRAGGSVPVTLTVKGSTGSHLAFIREVQRHPMTEAILHVDFYQVSLAETMRAQVPIYLVGEAPAVRLHEGVVMQALHSLEVECLPLDVPQSVEVDISGLEDFEMAVHVYDVSFADSVTIITDSSDLIARVNPPRVVVEDIVPKAEGEEAEIAKVGEEGPEASAESAKT
jgi:large subunit ribosomal protein L25